MKYPQDFINQIICGDYCVFLGDNEQKNEGAGNNEPAYKNSKQEFNPQLLSPQKNIKVYELSSRLHQKETISA